MSQLTLQSTAKLSSGYEIPLLGYGVALNRNGVETVADAIKVGYRHIDVAQHYGNETEVGEGVRASGVPRSEVFVTSKIMSQNHGYESTLAGVQQSLNRLGFDYINLFLIHDPLSGKERRLETYRALLKLRDDGKVKSVGVSNYGIHHFREIQTAGLELPTINQIEIHPFCQQKPIVEWCRKNNVVIEAYCPLIRGKMDHAVIVRTAEKHQRDPGQILIRWSLQAGFIPLPKSANPARIRSNADVYNFELDADDMKALNDLDQGAAGAISWNPVGAD
ncbi:hypothetical protein EWM64_g8090 [Hericium alpestre]|uniref:NADP-dependent oxidoreductase domain-containing protein n=1 Tax=Hericium alpestre TaxID=135208 RepID=A0A4Y9ZMB3_9AGAM|nr:hypothetical protein EWM64_g8090 [Hericium alpestre]